MHPDVRLPSQIGSAQKKEGGIMVFGAQHTQLERDLLLLVQPLWLIIFLGTLGSLVLEYH